MGIPSQHRWIRQRKSIALPLLLLSLTAYASGQQANDATLHVTTHLVVLDVTVTDQQGHLINNLPKDAFQLYEDKVPQTIRSFEQPAAHAPLFAVPVDSTAELDRLEPTAPVTILVLDEINTKSEDESFARYSLKKYLDTQGEQLQQPTMLIAVSTKRLTVLHDYTTYRSTLLDVLEHHFADYPWRLGSKNFQGDQLAAAFASLMQVAEATSGHAGHKNMVWIGRGFPNLNQSTVPPDVWDAIQRTIRICTNTLRDSRISLYTIDPAGVVVNLPDPDDDGFYEEDPFGGQINFNLMAMATGGQAFYARNDLDNLIGTSTRDGASFYTLTYSPSNKDETAKPFRNIQIRMKDPNLIATTRAGYYSQIEPPHPPAETALFSTRSKVAPISEDMADLLNAANSTMAYDGIHITISPDPGVAGNFLVRVKASDITSQSATSDAGTADIELLLESFDKKGVMLKRTAHVITVQAKSSDTDLNLLASLPPSRGAVRIRVVVGIRGSGKVGADNYDLSKDQH